MSSNSAYELKKGVYMHPFSDRSGLAIFEEQSSAVLLLEFSTSEGGNKPTLNGVCVSTDQIETLELKGLIESL